MALETAPANANNAFTRNHTQNATIAASETTSDEIVLGGRAVVNIHLPTVDAAYFTYLVKINPGDTAVQLVDTTGTAISYPRGSSSTTTGTKSYTEAALGGIYSVQLVSSASQSSTRTIGISARGQDPVPFDVTDAAAAIATLFPSAFTRVATYTKANLTAATAWTIGNSPQTLFTVTGQVLMQVMAVVTTGITSTGATGTLAVGVTGNTACLLPLTVMDGTNFPTGAVWTDATPTLKAESLGDAYAAVLVANTNVIVTIATNSVTAGGIIVYCRWIPISPGATVTGN